MDLNKLKEPFKPEDIEWRVQSSGIKNGKPWARVLAYVTNRAIMDRLDDVCGPDGWENEYDDAPGGGILCGITIYVIKKDDTVSVRTKWDGAEQTNIEAVKGGLSSAMKRAAVQWGIGRYLYNLEPMWAIIDSNGSHSDQAKDENGKKRWFKWNPPKLPNWALPEGTPKSPPREMSELDKAQSCWAKIKDTSRQHMEGLNRAERTEIMKKLDFDKDKINALCDKEIAELEKELAKSVEDKFQGSVVSEAKKLQGDIKI